VIAKGTIGKLLLRALVVGKASHACYPLDGVSSSYLAAELVHEFSPELSEEEGAELAVPPTVLGSRDLKPSYNVTIPDRDFVFWSVIALRRTTQEVFEIAERLTQRAMSRAAAQMRERSASLKNPMKLSPAWWKIQTFTFEQAVRSAAQRDNFADQFKEHAAALAGRDELDFPSRSRRLAEFAWEAARLEGPAIILLIGSAPYPANRLAQVESGNRLSQILTRVAQETSIAFNTPITQCEFFPAISDMSFLRPADKAEFEFISQNTPLWGSSIAWNREERIYDMPVINVGPWGRDYHHWLERTHNRYTFTVLPYLLHEICRTVLEEDSQRQFFQAL
jgi:arginine utilization protein RocB